MYGKNNLLNLNYDKIIIITQKLFTPQTIK